MTSYEDKIELIKKNIKHYPDFPKPGIVFRDIFPVLKDPDATKALHELMIAHTSKYIPQIQAVCSLESRGFLFGPLLAYHFHIPHAAIRKKGKLPGSVKSFSNSIEYGFEVFEIQTDAIKPGSQVLLVDDVVASGGTLLAGCELIKSIGSNVAQCLVVIELEELKGRNKVPSPVYSLIKL